MKYKLLSFLLVLTLCAACSKKAETTPGFDKQIRQYLSLVEAKQNPTPDLNQIKSCYGALSDILTQAGLEAQADQYLAQAEQATDAKQMDPPLEGLDKTVQQAIVIVIHNALDLIPDSPKNSTEHIDAVDALYGGIKSTAERRGKYIGSETFFTDTLDACMKKLRSGSDTSATIQQIKSTINDIYFLSVLYELEGITANRGVNEIVVQEKQTEGFLFYEIIHPSSKDNAVSEKVRAELAKNGNEIDIDSVKENLKLAFPEKSAQYKDKF